MPYNLYIGAGRGGAYPLPVLAENPDILVAQSLVRPQGGRTLVVRVTVRNSGNVRSDPFRLHLYRVLSSGLLTPLFGTRDDGSVVEAVVGPVTLIGGGPGQHYYLRADVSDAPTQVCAMVIVNAQVVQPVYSQRSMCGLRTV